MIYTTICNLYNYRFVMKKSHIYTNIVKLRKIAHFFSTWKLDSFVYVQCFACCLLIFQCYLFWVVWLLLRPRISRTAQYLTQTSSKLRDCAWCYINVLWIEGGVEWVAWLNNYLMKTREGISVTTQLINLICSRWISRFVSEKFRNVIKCSRHWGAYCVRRFFNRFIMDNIIF